MKKFLLIACCAICMMACKPKVDPNKPEPAATALAGDSVGKTLNGLDSAEAVKLIADFEKKPASDSNATSIWFSQAFVDDVYNIVSAQHGDGVRFYIGKKADSANTLIVLSTKDGGPYPDSIKPQSGRLHVDYFQHGIPVLDSPEVKNQDTYTVKLGDGADLYQDTTKKPCPTNTCIVNSYYVPCDDAKKFAQEFKAGPINTRSVWYGLDLIWYLRKQMYAASRNGKRVDGIRIYFAYDTKRKKHGFLVTPTENLKNVHQDFYDCYYFYDKPHPVFDHGEECPIFCKGGQ